MDELTILLVEDDAQICKNFVKCTCDNDDLMIVSITNNATKALADIKDYLPDVVILDLELHLGSGSGLDVLNGLPALQLDINPYMLITTNNSSNTTFEFARQLGADFIMSKHQQDYSEQSVLNFLKMMKSVIKSRKKSLSTASPTTEAPEMHRKRITQRIITELNFVGINPKAVGYRYLIDAILIVIDKPTQNLSVIIAQKYGKTDSSVERAMQNAINQAWRKTDIDELYQHYTAKIHSDKGMPTISEFIYYYANKIKNEY